MQTVAEWKAKDGQDTAGASPAPAGLQSVAQWRETQSRTVPEEPVMPVEETKKPQDGVIASAARSIFKKAADIFTSLQPKPEETLRQQALIYPSTYKPILAKYDAAQTDSEKVAALDEAAVSSPLVKVMNSDTGRKVIGAIGEGTSNVPLKTIASLRSLGDETYDEAYTAMLKARNDPTNPAWQSFLYDLQDSGPQTALGVLLAIGTTYAARGNVAAGNAAAMAYYSALSASEQQARKGKVYSPGDIAIDTVGDTLLGNMLVNVFGAPAKSLAKTIAQSFGVEGGTEVSQSLLKYANDYRNEPTQARKDAVLAEAKQYVASGQMLMEFAVAGAAGGLIGAGVEVAGRKLGVKTEDVSAPILKKEAAVGDAPKSGSVIEAPDFAEKRDTLRALEAEQQIGPSEDRTAEIARLREQLDDFYAAFKDRAVDVRNGGDPILQVDTVRYNDGQFGFGVNASAGQNGFSVPLAASEVFATKEEAVQAGLDAVKAWASSQAQTTQDEALKAEFDRVIKAAQSPETAQMPAGEAVVPETMQSSQEGVNATEEQAQAETATVQDEPPVAVAKKPKLRKLDTARVSALENDLREAYRKAGNGVIKGEELPAKPENPGMDDGFGGKEPTLAEWEAKVAEQKGQSKVEKALARVLMELELSEPGYRYGTGYGVDAEYHGVPSTFPQWIPESLRSKKLFEKLYSLLKIDAIKYPDKSQKRLRRLYDLLLAEVDRLAGIDTSEIRASIIREYDQRAIAGKEEGVAGSRDSGTTGVGGAEPGTAGRRGEAGGVARKTQKDIVKEVVGQKGQASIKAVAAETGILEPNIVEKDQNVVDTGTKPRIEEVIANSRVDDAEATLRKQIGDVFTIVNPVGDLWNSKGNTVFISLNRDRAGFAAWLRGKNFVENAQEAGNNVYKVELKAEKSSEPKNEIKIKKFAVDKRGVFITTPFGDKLPLNEDGTLTVYHRTTPEIAKKIRKEGLRGSTVQGEEGKVYVSTNQKGGRHIGSEKTEVLMFNVDPSKFDVDEAFRDGSIDLVAQEKDLQGVQPSEINVKADIVREVTQKEAVPNTEPANVADLDAKKIVQKHYGPTTPSGNAMAMYKPEDLPDFPVQMGGMDKVRAVEFPELVDIARELMGNVPRVVKKTGNAAGRFKARSGNIASAKILLVADIFKEGNLREAAKVLAHEMGHLTDYLPDATMKRGNLIGSLKTLRGFMGEYFGKEGALDTKAIRNAAMKEVMKESGVSFGEYMTSKDKRVELAPKIKARYNEKITATGGIRNSEIRRELLAVTRYWHPYDPQAVSESYRNYRESSRELYAEAISMLYNSPGLLEQMAPTFYREFFAALDKKPNVRDAYFKVQELMAGDREKLVGLRRAGVQKMFAEGDYKAGELDRSRRAEREKRANDLRFRLRYELVDKNARIIDLMDELKRKGVQVNPDDNPVYYLEERNYLGGKIKAVMERDFNPVYERVQKAGLKWDDLGELLFYERIVAGDRSEQANPRGITPAAAQELIDTLKKQYGDEGFTTLSQAAEDFRAGMKKIATEAYEEGLYTPELYQKMQENPAYVTFQVIEHIEDGVSSRVYKSIGTLKDITNPADASLLKMIATLRAIERNKVTQKTVDVLVKHHPDEIEEAKYRWNGRSKEPMRPKEPHQELITILEKGKVKGYYVDEYVAKSVENASVGQNNAIIGVLRFINSKTFRPLFITFNLGFQSFNLIRDFWRFYKNIPDMTLGRAFMRYGQAYRMSRIRAFGARATEADQAAFKTLQKLEYDQVLSVTFNDILAGGAEDEKQIERIMRESGIPSFADKKPRKWYNPLSYAPLRGILEVIENIGNLIETLPKAAGYYEFRDPQGEITKEQASFIRKYIGSPDFLAGGHIKPVTNEIFLFSNAITQGIRADYHIAMDPTTRSGFWWKTAKIQFLPKMLMMAAIYGLFGDALKKMFESVSEYDLTNYTIVPAGIDENGKVIYIRVPADETSRFLGGFLWKSVMAAAGKNDQNVGEALMDIASYTGGQLPSLSPVVEVGSATMQYLGGSNPYDAFRGRQVLSDQTFKAGGTASAKAYAGWVFQQLGGGIFYRFYYEPTAPEPQSRAEKIANLPVIGNILGRFVRVSDYGRQERLKNVQKNVEREEARASIREREIVNRYIGETQDKGIRFATGTTKNALVKEVLGHAPQTKDEEARANRIRKKFDLGLKRGSASPEVTALIDADTNKQKTAILQRIRSGMSESEWTTFRRQITGQGIVSDDVLLDKSLR